MGDGARVRTTFRSGRRLGVNGRQSLTRRVDVARVQFLDLGHAGGRAWVGLSDPGIGEGKDAVRTSCIRVDRTPLPVAVKHAFDDPVHYGWVRERRQLVS